MHRTAAAAGHGARAVVVLEQPKSDRVLAGLETERACGIDLRQC